jgi:hypothetical protein
MDYANGSMCGTSGDIFYRVSLDNGETWQPIGSITNTQSGEGSYSLILADRFHVAWNDNWPYGCSFPKETYSISSDFGVTWEIPTIISGEVIRSERHTAMVYTFLQADTVLHCFYYARTEDNTSSLFYIRSRDFVAVDEPGMSLPDRIDIVAYPNPFNTRTMISYAGDVDEIRIFNLEGRLIKIIPIAESQTQVIWDASDDSGKPVASGVYFAKAYGEDISAELKLVYLK